MTYWKNMFPDWEELKPGYWSEYGELIQYDDGEIETNLYRNKKGEYIIAIIDINDCHFYGDSIVFRRKVTP